MANPLSTRVPIEFTSRDGLHSPETSRRGRAILPSYASTAMTLAQSEIVTVKIPFGALTAATGTTVSATQYFASLTNLRLSVSDLGQIILANVSVQAPSTVVAGHPQMQVVTTQGNPQNGSLTPGSSYSRIGVKATITLYAMSTTGAGNVIVSATALVIGNALNG